MRLTLGPVMVGTAVPFRGEETSAIGKQPVAGPRRARSTMAMLMALRSQWPNTRP